MKVNRTKAIQLLFLSIALICFLISACLIALL